MAVDPQQGEQEVQELDPVLKFVQNTEKTLPNRNIAYEMITPRGDLQGNLAKCFIASREERIAIVEFAQQLQDADILYDASEKPGAPPKLSGLGNMLNNYLIASNSELGLAAFMAMETASGVIAQGPHEFRVSGKIGDREQIKKRWGVLRKDEHGNDGAPKQ